MESSERPLPPPKRRLARTLVVIAAALILLITLALVYASRHAEPFVRARIIRTLEERTHQSVELDHVGVSITPVLIAVSGEGLRIRTAAGKALVSANSFNFSTGLRDLYQHQSALVSVHVQGLRIDIPAGPTREQTLAPFQHAFTPADARQGRFSIMEVLATDATLSIDRLDPSHPPLVFAISRLHISQSAPGKPFVYQATLTNPKPIGEINASGNFGPWNSHLPRDTPIDGGYTLAHADLSTIPGIRGILEGQGTVTGSLGALTTDGSTQVAGFALDLGTPATAPGTLNVALTTHFHAIVDATTGDLDLQPVTAHFLHTDILATGRIGRTSSDTAHDILLDTTVHGRLEDLLALVSRGKAPLLHAALTDRARLHIPPGPQRVLLKLETSGQASLTGALWSDPAVQQKVDALSMRAQGRAEEAADEPHALPVIASSLQTHFHLVHGTLQLDGLTYALPGATVLMSGIYDLPSEALDFRGMVRTQASPSDMITGWKSLVLKPFDPLFKRNGAGLQLPISLTGTRAAPRLGLDFEHHPMTPLAPAPKPSMRPPPPIYLTPH